jgi:prepilin signal peptidase PulO-like enzyme (type II secretory pathway)
VHWQHLLYSTPEHRVRGRGPGHIARLVIGAAGCGIVTGVAFRPDHYDAFPALLTALFCCALVVLSSTDFERRLLPNRLTYPAILLAAATCWAWPDRSIADIWIGAGVAFGVGAGLFVMGIFLGSARGVAATPFGLGDVKLIILIGLLSGWPAFGTAIVIGVVLAGLPALVMVFLGRGRSVFSYGPYLAAGGAIVLLFPASFV